MRIDRRRSGRERRRAERVSSTFAVKTLMGVEIYLAQGEDIAQAGITMRRPDGDPMPIGVPMTLSFDLPGSGEEITVKGVVVSDRAAGQFRRTGVRFTTVSRRAQQIIASYCATRSQGASCMGGYAASL